MKKITNIFLVIFLLFLSGCSGGKSHGMTEQQKKDYDVQASIQEQIENTAIPRGYSTLLADEGFVTVLCNDGAATVTIKAFKPYTIPYVAEFFLPVAQEAVETAGVTLERFSVKSYNENKDGIVSETFADWHTYNGERGPLADNTSGESVVKPDLTIEQLYEEYADYKRIVSDMIVEAGGEAISLTDCETILESLENGGIPIIYSIVYTKENDPNVLNYGEDTKLEYEQKANFADERIEPNYDNAEPKSGTIEVFLTSKRAASRADSLYSSTEDIYSIRILADNILIRLSGDYTEEQAKEISSLVGGTIHSIGNSLKDSGSTTQQTTYWINSETKKFHKPSCSYIQGGRSTTESRSTLIARGYSPCGHCNP